MSADKTNKERVLEYIWAAGPAGVTNREIRDGTGVGTQQSIYMLTRELAGQGIIRDVGEGREKRFVIAPTLPAHFASPGPAPNVRDPEPALDEFEALARRVLGEHYGVTFAPAQSLDVHRRFALVAENWRYGGDVLYVGMPSRRRLPMAKFALISETVWCLQRADTEVRLLVVGGDRDVIELWLHRFGNCVPDVTVFFLSNDGELSEVAGAGESGPMVQRGMQWYGAESSMISAFGYDEAEQVLEVAFNRSGVYRYFDVPKEVFEGLREASSKGSYMRHHVIDMFPYEHKR